MIISDVAQNLGLGETSTDEKEDEISSFEGDGLPDIDNHDNDIGNIFDDNDGRYYDLDADEPISISSDTKPDDTPLYQNQEEDPEVASIMFLEQF